MCDAYVSEFNFWVHRKIVSSPNKIVYSGVGKKAKEKGLNRIIDKINNKKGG